MAQSLGFNKTWLELARPKIRLPVEAERLIRSLEYIIALKDLLTGVLTVPRTTKAKRWAMV